MWRWSSLAAAWKCCRPDCSYSCLTADGMRRHDLKCHAPSVAKEALPQRCTVHHRDGTATYHDSIEDAVATLTKDPMPDIYEPLHPVCGCGHAFKQPHDLPEWPTDEPLEALCLNPFSNHFKAVRFWRKQQEMPGPRVRPETFKVEVSVYSELTGAKKYKVAASLAAERVGAYIRESGHDAQRKLGQ